MKTYLLLVLTSISLCLFSNASFAQPIDLGSAANYVLFSSNGAVLNTGTTHLTGNVGANIGNVSGFGNVDGGMHNIDPSTSQGATDLLNAYNTLNARTPTAVHASLLGSGETLNAGIYGMAGHTDLSGNLTLDGQGNANAQFIFKVSGGTFTSAANAQVILINGAVACNVFWVIEGAINIGANTIMKGNIIANNPHSGALGTPMIASPVPIMAPKMRPAPATPGLLFAIATIGATEAKVTPIITGSLIPNH